MGKPRKKPWPPPEPDALGFFGTVFGLGTLVFAGSWLHWAHNEHAGGVHLVVASLVVLALATFSVYCISRLFRLPRHTWTLGLVALLPAAITLRAARARVARAEAYETLRQVCSGTPVASAGSVERERGHAALFLLTGQPWEPRPAWAPTDVSSTALVGCVRACGTEVRIARTAEIIGCVKTEHDLALLIDPVER